MGLKHYAGLWLALLVLALAVFYPGLNAFFVSDDWHWLTLAMNSTSLWPNFFTNYQGTTVGGSYNPVVSLWFNAGFRLWGFDYTLWHLAGLVVHSLNACLVAVLYVQLTKMWPGVPRRPERYAAMAAVLFLLWPTVTEAVLWIASIPHLLATFFSLITILLYWHWRRHKGWGWLTGSLVSCFLAFGSKETAVILPFILLALEISYYFSTRPRPRKSLVLFVVPFFLLLTAWLYLRWQATGLFLGNYAESSLRFNWYLWWQTFLTFWEEFLTLGLARKIWMSVYWPWWLGFTLIIVLFALGLLAYWWRNRWHQLLALVILTCVSTLPFLPLGFNRMSAEGERYTYLPLIFFICLVVMIMQFRLSAVKLFVCLAFVLPLLAGVSWNKAEHWRLAGLVAQKIILDFHEIARSNAPDTRYLVLALPDTLSGAQVWRNNLQQALDIQYGLERYQLISLPVYLQLTAKNFDKEVLVWRNDERGWLARSVDGSFVVTGRDRVDTGQVIFELWNYDYNRYSSDTIRLILKDDFKSQVARRQVRVVLWHQGRLQELQWQPEALIYN